MISADGPDHAKTFTVEVMMGKQVLGTGRGRSKQTAEKEAALRAARRWPAIPRAERLGAGMHLKRLEIHGFKSFATRAVFDVAPGITA